MERDHIECPICYSLIIEPIKIKCGHIFFLICIEKLTLDANVKCPLDRIEYNYEKDLIYDDSVMEINFRENSEEFKKKAFIILKKLNERLKIKEVQILYGNTHESVNSSTNNKHKWTCYVKVSEPDVKIKAVLENFKRKEKLNSILGIDKEEISKGIEKIPTTLKLPNKNLDDIIKSVTFNLHPTFNPPSVKVSEPPFQISRIGWGVFEIEIKIEFLTNLNIETIKLNHFLSFSDEDSLKVKTIYIELI